MTDEEMEEALDEDAPRVVKLDDGARWELWSKKQIEESFHAHYERRVADGFWVPENNGTWRFHYGILPEFIEGKVAVGLFGNTYFQDQDYEPEEEKQLSRSSHKALSSRMKKLVVAEVFSPPRVSEYAEKHGHLAGGAFDLVT